MTTFYRPEYGYTTSPKPGANITRGRLFAGGTYWRTIDPSNARISVQLLESTETEQDSYQLSKPKTGSILVKNYETNQTTTYPLTWLDVVTPADPTVTPPTDQSVVAGWDPAALRASFSNPDIEMLPRSGTPPQVDPLVPVVPVPVVDVQDTGYDPQFLSPFPETFLTGGGQLPTKPARAGDGLTGTMVHTVQEEAHDGSVETGYFMYEWAASADGKTGFWKAFGP